MWAIWRCRPSITKAGSYPSLLHKIVQSLDRNLLTGNPIIQNRSVPSTAKLLTWERNMSTPDNLELATYVFPQRRLKSSLNNSKKDPLVLVACGQADPSYPHTILWTDRTTGSFNPITFLHLRMFEMAYDHVKLSTDFEVVGSISTPDCSRQVKAQN